MVKKKTVKKVGKKIGKKVSKKVGKKVGKQVKRVKPASHRAGARPVKSTPARKSDKVQGDTTDTSADDTGVERITHDQVNVTTTTHKLAKKVVAGVRTRLKKLKGDENNINLLSKGDVISDVTEWINAGFPQLNDILGGGWGVGRASEVYGVEGSGKSAMSHVAIKSCQEQGGFAVLLDFENAFDKYKMHQMGINPEALLHASPSHAEEGWDITWDVLASIKKSRPKAPTLLVWDSIAAAPSLAEMGEDTSAQKHYGGNAACMSKGCRKLYKYINQVRAHMMFVNQIRTKIGAGSFEDPHLTPGGHAVKFAASYRVKTSRAQIKTKIDGEEFASGYLIYTRTDKCRLAPPHRKTTWVLDFKYGPSLGLTAMKHLIEWKVLTSTAQGITIPGWDKKVRKNKWAALWMENEDFRTLVMGLYQPLTRKKVGIL